MSTRIGLLAVSMMLAAVPLAHSSVLVVDQGGGPGVYTSPQAAINAAADGDIILVHAGDYTFPFLAPYAEINGISLTLIADPPGADVKSGTIIVKNIPAGRRVVLRGLDLTGFSIFGAGQPGLTVTNSPGGVWVEDGILAGGTGPVFFNQGLPGEPGLRATQSTVTAVRCSMVGGAGFTGPVPMVPGHGGVGIELTNGSLALLECTVIGGTTQTTSTTGGGDGLSVVASKVVLSGGSATGGKANGTFYPPGSALVADVASQVQWLDEVFATGSGGSPTPVIDAPPGVVTSWPGQARSFAVSSPAHQQQQMSVDMKGVPGDLVLLLWSPLTGHSHIGGTKGSLLLASPLFGPFVFVSITHPSGVESFTSSAPPLIPATLDGFAFLVQAYFVNSSEKVAGSGSAFLLLQ